MHITNISLCCSECLTAGFGRPMILINAFKNHCIIQYPYQCLKTQHMSLLGSCSHSLAKWEVAWFWYKSPLKCIMPLLCHYFFELKCRGDCEFCLMAEWHGSSSAVLSWAAPVTTLHERPPFSSSCSFSWEAHWSWNHRALLSGEVVGRLSLHLSLAYTDHFAIKVIKLVIFK